MAEAVFRHLASRRLGCTVEELRGQGIDTVSAGVAAGDCSPASPEAIELLRERGIDLSDHLSQQVTSDILSESDRIFVMTGDHLRMLQSARPDLSGRMELLRRDGRDVSDPIGCSPEYYRACADELTSAIQTIIQEIFEKDTDVK